jgi:hypothetical protein
MNTSPVSARLDGIVRGRSQRRHLKGPEGLWADEVLRACAFLETRGIHLDTIDFHFRGSGIWYRGHDVAVLFDYEPEFDPPGLGASIGLRGRDDEGLQSVDRLLRDWEPQTVFPDRSSADPATISANVQFWATGIRRLLDRPGGLVG